MTLDEMRAKKSETGLSYEQISKRSGVPLGTVQKVMTGATKSPRYHTLQALQKVFEDIDGQSDRSDEGQTAIRTREPGSVSYTRTFPSPGMVAEDTVPYHVDGNTVRHNDLSPTDSGSRIRRNHHEWKEPAGKNEKPKEPYTRQGNYTIRDYLALPDDQRAELIDGTFYDMAAPSMAHQIICACLTRLFGNYIEDHGGLCEVISSPADVQLDQDDRTIVQPDVMIVCHPEKIRFNRLYGSPDLVVEVLSRSTRDKDRTLKLWKYFNAGVREYWLVDPDHQTITVFRFRKEDGTAPGTEQPEEDDWVKVYSFQDRVPVGIYGDDLVIDFSKIWKRISRFYPQKNKP